MSTCIVDRYALSTSLSTLKPYSMPDPNQVLKNSDLPSLLEEDQLFELELFLVDS